MGTEQPLEEANRGLPASVTAAKIYKMARRRGSISRIPFRQHYIEILLVVLQIMGFLANVSQQAGNKT